MWYQFLILITLFVAFACGPSQGAEERKLNNVTAIAKSAAGTKYLTYETYRSLVALYPELTNPRLLGVEPAGMELWSKGQMRVPAITHLFEGDFNDDGKPDAAIVVKDRGKNYVVIAQRTGEIWRKAGLIPTKSEGIKEWNGRALRLADDSLIAWDSKRYRLEKGPLAFYCYGYEPTEFAGVMLKLTYVGPQTEPYPGLLISSFYRWVDLEAFKVHRRRGVHYGNDDMLLLWHITVSPQELSKLAKILVRSSAVRVAEDRTGGESRVWHSLTLLDKASPHRDNFYEVFLEGPETISLLKTFAAELEPANRSAAKVLSDYTKMFGNVQ